MFGAGSYCITTNHIISIHMLRHGEVTSIYGNTSTLCCKDSAKPCITLGKLTGLLLFRLLLLSILFLKNPTSYRTYKTFQGMSSLTL